MTDTKGRESVRELYSKLREEIAADIIKQATNAAHFLPGINSVSVLDVIHAAVAVGKREALTALADEFTQRAKDAEFWAAAALVCREAAAQVKP